MRRRDASVRGAGRPMAATLLMPLAGIAFVAGCGPEVVRIDRTEGRALRLFWEDDAGERAAYYEVATDGLFRSGGGLVARDRRTTFRTELSDADLATFRRLLDAASRAGATGDGREPDGAGLRIDLEWREGDSGWETLHAGASDAATLELRDWCATVALRQFDATIDALPEPGLRRR